MNRRIPAALLIAGALLIPTVPAVADAGSTVVDSLTNRLDRAHDRIDCLEDRAAALQREVRLLRSAGNGVSTVGVVRVTCPR